MKKTAVKKITEAFLPTKYGNFQILIFKSNFDQRTQVVLIKGDIKKQPVLLRVHSKCLTGDTLASLKCDCGKQLDLSLKKIAKSAGILIYLNQEGRDIGLENKIKAYALQDKGEDTVEANLDLGLPIDARDYEIAALILKYLKVKQVKLLTNNPDKTKQLEEGGIKISKIIPLEAKPNKFNKFYLQTKKKKMDHKLKMA
ncbi:MAG: GTP cyclohydrolase II [Candidatus Magasanikbacteria bacterium]|nr:GTP cyclohydrolase II [Candidatus Magasanikbacteria bacterium]